MNKKNYVHKRVGEDIWEIFRKVYEISSSNPTSEKQQKLLDEVSDYVYDKFATQLSRDKLKRIFGEGD
jgi:hypothetical protein